MGNNNSGAFQGYCCFIALKMKTKITKIKNTLIKGTHDKPILCDLFFKKNKQPKPIVIFCHGYKGFKDWGAWNLVADEFAKNNLFFVKFNFSHNGGTVEQQIDFPDLEAFSENNYSIELDDLESVINFSITNANFEKEIDKKNITLIGHSRGGGIVSLKSSKHKKITRLITWSGISDIDYCFAKDIKISLEQWEEEGVAYNINSRTLQKMPHKYQFYANYLANKEELNIQKAVQKIEIPHLIIHGTFDKDILPEAAKNLYKWSENSKLILINNMGHALGNKQPWLAKKMPKDLKKVVKESIQFILKK